MDDDGADAAMKEMMGFSSFGNNKRQKLNTSSENAQPARPPATSSNNTPLGQRQEKTSRATSNLRFVPASLPPSGRSSKSPTPDETPNQEPPPLAIDQKQADLESEVQSHPQNPASLSASSQTFNLLPSTPQPEPSHHHHQLPTRPTTTTTTYTSSDIRSDPSYWSQTNTSATVTTPTSTNTTTNNHRPQSYLPSRIDRETYENEIGYTSPWTGATMTRKELLEYGKGRMEEREDGRIELVFFKPGFVDEGLWDQWEEGKEKEVAV
ncbi:hypothetical protein LTR64_008001 [Lithohypha guttulata]|uniref:uncharacterized protein n=1 Tax=Lithohypha guttulata TaxID=1690604 RepID=UPI002DE03115|nr:hypothetical protein LTR51_008130 [Lithohypha guttulata]